MFYNDPVTEVRLARFAQRQRDQRLELLRRSIPSITKRQAAPVSLFARFGSYLGHIRPLARRTA